jgi:hypothetical protein
MMYNCLLAMKQLIYRISLGLSKEFVLALLIRNT